MFEKRWAAVPAQFFISNGASNGTIKVIDSSLFKVKQAVNISSSVLPNLNLEIKSIPDDVTILVGPIQANIFTYSDVSAYLVANNASISAIEQKRSSVPQEEIIRAVYEEEPVVATRVIGVSRTGNTINWSEDGIVPQEFDDIQLTRDLDGDIVDAKFFQSGSLQRELELTYDVNKDLIRVRKI